MLTGKHFRELFCKRLIQLSLNPCPGRLLRCCFLLFRFSGFRSFCLRFRFSSLKVAASINFCDRCCFRLFCRCFFCGFSFLRRFFCHIIEVKQCHLTFRLHSAVFLHRLRRGMVRNTESVNLFKTFQFRLPMRRAELLHVITCIEILHRNAKITVDCNHSPLFTVISDMISDFQCFRICLLLFQRRQLLIAFIRDCFQRFDYMIGELHALIISDNLTNFLIKVLSRIQFFDLLSHCLRIVAALRFVLCRFFRSCGFLCVCGIGFFLR